MKTKNITLIVLLAGITIFAACNTQPANEAAREVAEKYITGLNERDPEVFLKYCRGELKEGMEGVMQMSELGGYDFFDFFPEKLEITYCEMVPGFKDIAIAVATNPENGLQLSYIMQLRNDGNWKLMYQEGGDISAFQSLMTSDILADYGIYTVSDKDLQEAKEFLGW